MRVWPHTERRCYCQPVYCISFFINSRSSIRRFDLKALLKFLKIFQVENKSLQFHQGWRKWIQAAKENLCVSLSAADPFQFRFFRCLVIYRKSHTWKNNKCEPNTEPCLVVCAIKFDRCENISDGVSEAQNGSKENHENVVPFKFYFHHRFDLTKKILNELSQKQFLRNSCSKLCVNSRREVLVLQKVLD